MMRDNDAIKKCVKLLHKVKRKQNIKLKKMMLRSERKMKSKRKKKNFLFFIM